MRDPSTLSFQSENVRRAIIASYWAVIILALPLWWRTTSIERLALPTNRVTTQAEKQLELPVHVSIPRSHSSLSNGLQDEINLLQRGIHASFSEGGSSAGFSHYAVKNGRIPSIRGRELEYNLEDEKGLAKALSELLAPAQRGHLVVPYSPQYRLSFTLLNEDSTSGTFIPTWHASEAVKHFMSPFFDQLSLLHNFTVESQVQYHAPLAFKPQPLENGHLGLRPEDLSVFVNSAEWTLSSSASNDPVLHFIVFVPAQPLHILDADGNVSQSRSFLLPQWGGIVIHNPSPSESQVENVFPVFTRQLLTLLGVPPLPSSIPPPVDNQITQWQLDALLRTRTLENTVNSQDTLRSIVTLVDQIEGMPVGANVKDDINDALKALERVYASSLSLDSHETVVQSTKAFVLASRAFFNPDMLALLYFPAEHKYAVYSPLFASAVIPLIAAAMREIIAWRKQRREAQNQNRAVETH